MQNALAIFLPSGVALAIAVGGGLWQDRRQRKERERKEKEDTTRLLHERAEDYSLTAAKAIDKAQLAITPLVNADTFNEAVGKLVEDIRRISMLESYYFGFLEPLISELFRQVISSSIEFRRELWNVTLLQDPLEAEPNRTRYENLKELFRHNIALARESLDKIPNLDLYKLYTEWRKKRLME